MKKILLSLFVGLIGFISFGYCINYSNDGRATYSSSQTFTFNESDLVCAKATVTNRELSIVISNNSYTIPAGSMSCFYGVDNLTFNYNNTNLELYVYQNFIDSVSCPVCPTCPNPYTSLECQELYNLIPIEDIDINYCVGNGLCPNESGTGDFSGDLQFSNIYINNVLHPGRQNIFVTIPDYITWDYAFTGDDFNIYVGSGYDEEYINSIIKINSYRPTTTDFSDIFISGLTLIFPYIVVTLFIVFVWRLLKRIFK